MAFLHVVTRTFGRRPAMLRRNRESLLALTSEDWMQEIVHDEAGRGVDWACANLATVAAQGDYVWVLDDDDVCCCESLVQDLQAVAYVSAPPVIMVRARHDVFGLLPSQANWGQRPVRGNVGTSCYVIRADVWEATRRLWRAVYDADFWYIDALWQQGLRFAWLDVMAAWYPQQSLGAGQGGDITADNGERIGDEDAR